MAIEFNCPHCKTHYRLKDEFGGKTATCKNPNCRKVIPIPKPSGNGRSGAPVDVDALAAAAFSDDAVKAVGGSEEMIQVTCSGCDHVWSVEASKEGKNVLCPECRRPNRVPMRKKEEKADWRTGGGPSLAKRETGLDREGAFGNVAATGISQDTAREIVKGREAEEEPEERRKRLIKRGLLLVLGLAVLGVGGYFALKTKREITSDANMADAVKELTERGKDAQGKVDPRLDALIHRASAEYRGRTSASADDASAALNDIKIARNRAKDARGGKGGSPTDADGMLAEVAMTVPLMLGVGDDADRSPKKDKLVTEFRQALQEISDADLRAEVVRTVTRRAAAKDQPTFAAEVTQQRVDHELTAQVALELLRVNRDKYRGDAEELLKKLGTADTPGVQALRAVLGKQAPAKKEGEPPPTPSAAARAEAEAIKGNAAGAKGLLPNVPKPEDKAKAMVAIAHSLIDTNPAEAGSMLKDAAKILKDVKGSVSPWVSARACEMMGKLGLDAEAESLAASLPDEPTRSWARLAALRGRLEILKGKGDDSWLDAVGDPTKLAAAAKAREVMARHNAAQGHGGEYQGVVKKWPSGTVRPFGTAGIVLGQLDKREQK